MPFVSFPWLRSVPSIVALWDEICFAAHKNCGKKGSSSSHFSYVQLFALLKDFERDIKLQGSK